MRDSRRTSIIISIIIFVIFLLVLWLLSPNEPEPKPAPEAARYTASFPLVRHNWQPCRENRGIGWLDLQHGATTLNRLRACWYYNGWSYRFVKDGRAIPIIRPPTFPAPAERIIAKLGADYDGYILVLNEPEGLTQDNMTPAEAAAWVAWVAGQLPHAQMVGPNSLITSTDWIADYLAAGGRPFDVWGVHVYAPSPCAIADCIRQLCAVVPSPCRLWVTEVGYPMHWPRPAERLGGWLAYLESDVRVERIFGYTAVGGCCAGNLAFIRNNNLTVTGQAWIK